MKIFSKILFWTHLVIGLAAGGVIAVVAFTGATMAFEKQIIAWAEPDLRHIAPPAPTPSAKAAATAETPRLPLEKVLAQLPTTHPDARPAGIVVSADPTEPLTFSLGRTGSLYVNPYTGAVLRRSGLSDLSFRQAMRALNRTLHTGEAGGLVGQSLAFLACVGGLVLVYTGFALSYRRFFKRSPKRAPAVTTAPAGNASPIRVHAPTVACEAAATPGSSAVSS